MLEAVYKAEAKYENITLGTWSRHSDHIGDPSTSVDPSEFVGAERTGEYLMPKSAL
jgi:hypothetical protein